MNEAQKNFALIVPTKALINEVRGKVIDDLGEKGNPDKINYLEKYNYRVVMAASDIALEEDHNFIFVLTPERLLYLLISEPKVQIDYLFIDEAHKLSEKNSRAPFYYKVVDMLMKREHKPHFIFASPNIPNPQVYIRMMTDIEAGDDNKLSISYSLVVHREFKQFLTDEDEIKIRETFKNAETVPDEDINTSVDQTKSLIMAIEKDNLHYPEVQNGFFKHDAVLDFLDDLSRVFRWDLYESSTLGKPSLRSWYAVILSQWMEGNGLNYIMRKAMEHRKKNPQDF